MTKILFIIDCPLTSKMPSGAIRYFELSKCLSKKYEVSLAAEYIEKDFIPPKNVGLIKEPAFINFNLGIKIKLPNKSFIKKAADYDVIITQGRIASALKLFPLIKDKLILDLYAPWYIEDLVSKEKSNHTINMKTIKGLLSSANYFLCANERQKQMYLGMMLLSGKKDPILHEKIGVAPLGIEKYFPKDNKDRTRKLYKNTNKNDKIILWWGGLWDWLDSETVVKAAEKVLKERNDIKFVFYGKSTYGSEKNISAKAIKTMETAKKLGLLEKNVFFYNEWTDYNSRFEVLREADAGIVSHYNSIETIFSARTRAMDFFWAKLPIITADFDLVAEDVKKYKMGAVFSPQNPEDLAAKILDLFKSDDSLKEAKKNIEVFRVNIFWENIFYEVEKMIDKIISIKKAS